MILARLIHSQSSLRCTITMQDVVAEVVPLSASRLSRKHTVPYHAYAKRDVSCCDYPNWFAAHGASRPAMSTVPFDVLSSISLCCHLLIDSQPSELSTALKAALVLSGGSSVTRV